MRRIATSLLLLATLPSMSAGAQDRDKKDKAADSSARAPIRVCVAEIRNVARRSVSLSLQRDHLIKDLNQSKPPKKAADKRTIEAIAISGDSAGTVENAPRDQRCDFIL